MTPEDYKAEEALRDLRKEEAEAEFCRETRTIPMVKDTNPKDALGIKKPSLTTIPFPVLYEVGTAMLEGACKYRRHNYRVAGVRASVYVEACFRHIVSYWEGEDIDPDSGLHHVSKAIASLVVLRDAMMNGMVTDDRPPRARAGWMDKVQDRVDDVLKRYPNPLPPYTHEQGLDLTI